MWHKIFLIALILFGAAAAMYLLAIRHPVTQNASGDSTAILVVAAENFWGSIAREIGGARVRVRSIVSDPNADPHEYETDAGTARAVAEAQYVIENGAGYDSWIGKLLEAEPNPDRKTLKVADLLQKKEGDNPHFWYNPEYVNLVAAQITHDLTAIDPQHAGTYAMNYVNLQSSLARYQNQIAEIKNRFAGVKVAATEDIFVYLAEAAGLDLVSPPAFMQAVAEENDPPAESIVQFEDQLKSRAVRVLVYNQQTITPLTKNMKRLADAHGIPTIGITETVQPSDASFEAWMNGEIAALARALAQGISR